MSKIRKLMLVCAMALTMMGVGLPSALAQPVDWCFYGCDSSWWAPAVTEPAPTVSQDEDRFIVVARDDDCWLVWDRERDELGWVCED